jgi:exopolyphosphatase/guanosine-5'-triphosphate,3'-diphosphate pyrophosphatase
VDPGKIVAVGTAQARDAGNAREFFDSIESETGIRFRILSGDEEARATFLGAALPGMDSQRVVVMDIGGGSTELVAIPEGRAIFGESLGIGAVKITENFLKSDPVTDSEFWAAENAIDEMLGTLKHWRKELETRIREGDLQFVAVAGTAVTLAMLQSASSKFNPIEIDGAVLTRGDAHRLVEELKWRKVDERKLMPGMEPKRADVILAGALIFWRAMEVLDFREAVISTRGLRYGVLGEFTT